MSKKIKLNLGSGKDYRPNWINIDVLPKMKPDLVHDLQNRFPYQDNSVDYVLAQDILEHFIRDDAENFLKEIYRVLKPGGALEIRVPDIQALIKIYSESLADFILFTYGETDETGVWGSHKYGYTKDSLAVFLKIIGFEIISIQTITTNICCVVKKSTSTFRPLSIVIIEKKQPKLTQNSLNIIKTITESEFKIITLLKHPFSFSGLFFLRQIKLFKGKDKIDLLYLTGNRDKFLLTLVGYLFKIPIFWQQESSIASLKYSFFGWKFLVWKILAKLVKKFIVFSTQVQTEVINDGHVLPSKTILFDQANIISRKRLFKQITECCYLAKYNSDIKKP